MTSHSAPHRQMIVACDIDSTLTFGGRPPTPEILDALGALARMPRVRLVIATSRSPRSIRAWFGPLLPHLDMVCCDGALWMRPGGVRWVRAVPSYVVGRVLRRLDRAGAGYAVDYGHAFMVRDPQALPWMGFEHRLVAPGRSELPAQGVLRICVAETAAARAAVAGMGELTVFAHRSGDADIVLAGNDKSVAVQAMRRLDAPAFVSAFGDDENDRALLQVADRGYVVGDRLPDLDSYTHITRIGPADVEMELRGLSREPRALAATHVAIG